MKITDRAYIAGIIDGEGCISLSNPRPRDGCSEHVLRVGMCDKRVIYYLRRATGVGRIQKPRVLPSGRVCWTWNVSIRPAVQVLQQLLPFLRVKKEQARLFIRASRVGYARRVKYVARIRALKEAR